MSLPYFEVYFALIRLLIDVFDVGGLVPWEFGSHIIIYLQLGFATTMASFSLGNVRSPNTQKCDVLFQNQNKLCFYIISIDGMKGFLNCRLLMLITIIVVSTQDGVR